MPDKSLVSISWDPITRIVGSLGIHTKIDFANKPSRRVPQHLVHLPWLQHLPQGQGPDAHFITSRICGICGDNHATCAATRRTWRSASRPPRAEWIINLGEAAEYMFDHNLFQTISSASISANRWSRRPTPRSSQRRRRRSPRMAFARISHDRRHHASAQSPSRARSISKPCNEPAHAGDVLPDGRPACASVDLYPGGVGTVPSVQLFTDYLVRLMKYVEFMKRRCRCTMTCSTSSIQASAGLRESRRARVLLGCWGSFNDPDACDYTYANMANWGRAHVRQSCRVVDGS